MKPVARRRQTIKVPFSMIRINTDFRYDGVTYHKFRAKHGITADGKVVVLTDSTLVDRVAIKAEPKPIAA